MDNRFSDNRFSRFSDKAGSHHIMSKSIAFGILVVATGLALLLKNTGLISPEIADLIFSWQMLLIALGVINLFGRGKWFGIILILTGGFYLASKYYNFPVDFQKIFWPSLIILAGVLLVFSAIKGFWIKKRWFTGTENTDFIEELNVFGGTEKTIVSDNFKGGKIISVFGGSKFNMINSKLAEGTPELEMIIIFGGSLLIVPSDWNIRIETANIFGGFSDKRSTNLLNTQKTLIIKGISIFGGGEIKSF